MHQPCALPTELPTPYTRRINEIIIGLEPITFLFNRQNALPSELNYFQKKMIAVCVSMVAEGPDSDRESPAYGAGELPFLYPAI